MASLKSMIVRLLDPYWRWKWARDRHTLLRQLPKGSVGVEIGVWKGAFSRQVVDLVQPREYHLVDPWVFVGEQAECMYGGTNARMQQDMDAIHASVVEAFAQHPEVFIHRQYSMEAVGRFADGSLDWVYVNGDHYYDGVMQDLEAYYPKLRKGGLLCGDDLYWTKPSLNGDKPVERAVHDLVRKHGVKDLRLFGSQFIITKP